MCSNKKSIIVIFPREMNIGGVEKSLLGLLNAFDYDKYDVDLFLYGHHGSLFPMIDRRVHLLPEVKELAYLYESFAEKIKHGCWRAVFLRILAHIEQYFGRAVVIDQVWLKLLRWNVPKLKKKYNLALNFNEATDYMREKVEADVKVGWIHTDYTGSEINKEELRRNYAWLDCIAVVSEGSKRTFCKLFPDLSTKAFVVENILSKALINGQSDEFPTDAEMPNDGTIRLLSIGRFCKAKNFDNVPEICCLLRKNGLNVKWYLIGFGSDEALIKKKIAEFGMENSVIILGKKENPYPYIKACDIYVQPSRYEGKSVAVREAQMLQKPIVITNYATSGSQLHDGYDGIIVPMDNEGCAEGLAKVIRNRTLQNTLIENTKRSDYTNSCEVEKLYQLIRKQRE